ncbi:MAG: hypothetical protein ACRC33_14345 [Gemmataceae bacterium]
MKEFLLALGDAAALEALLRLLDVVEKLGGTTGSHLASEERDHSLLLFEWEAGGYRFVMQESGRGGCGSYPRTASPRRSWRPSSARSWAESSPAPAALATR